MSQKKQLSILEFSRLTGITRDNLRFYDRIGLLKPEIRGKNGYRYYTRHQLGSAYLIGSLRLLDFIREQGMEVAGNAYGEYLLDDLAIQAPAQYYGRLEILVKYR